MQGKGIDWKQREQEKRARLEREAEAKKPVEQKPQPLTLPKR